MDPMRIDSFILKTKKSAGGCIEWQGAKNRNGYGHVRRPMSARRALIHRVIYEEMVAPIESGVKLEVCHRCDNPACVNPTHLFLGTHTDNMRDASQKGRLNRSRCAGLKNGNAKLSEEQVAEIAALKGVQTQAAIAKRFGVGSTAVRMIHQGRRWKTLLTEAKGQP